MDKLWAFSNASETPVRMSTHRHNRSDNSGNSKHGSRPWSLTTRMVTSTFLGVLGNELGFSWCSEFRCTTRILALLSGVRATQSGSLIPPPGKVTLHLHHDLVRIEMCKLHSFQHHNMGWQAFGSERLNQARQAL